MCLVALHNPHCCALSLLLLHQVLLAMVVTITARAQRPSSRMCRASRWSSPQHLHRQRVGTAGTTVQESGADGSSSGG